MKYTLIYLFLMIAVAKAQGQPQPSRSYNIYNGLPSNHIYNCIVDRNGYLWMTSPKGVIKFNGYDLRVFNFADGLPKEDVWYLKEDRMGRIWLGCITEEIGYIYNDKYHGLNISNTRNTLYPHAINRYKNGITFSSSYTSGSYVADVFIIDSDRINKLSIPNAVFLNSFSFDKADSAKHMIGKNVNWSGYSYIEHDTSLIVLLKNSICRYSIADKHNIKTIQITKIRSANFDRKLAVCISAIYDNYMLLSYPTQKNCFAFANRNTGDTGDIFLAPLGIKEDIQFIHFIPEEKRAYVLTKNNLAVFKITDSIRLEYTKKLNSIFSDKAIDGSEIIGVFQNDLWGHLYTTKNNGLIVGSDLVNPFHQTRPDLKGYDHLGTLGDSMAFWWNSTTSRLAEILPDNRIKYRSFGNMPKITGIAKYASDTLLMLGQVNHFLVNNRTSVHPIDIYQGLPSGIFSFHIMRNGKLIIASNLGLDLSDFAYHKTHLSTNRFSDIAADPVKEDYWAYNNSDLVIYNSRRNNTFNITKEKLQAAGIGKIETIAIDPFFGNVFIKDNNSVLIYDRYANKAHPVPGLENINARDCSMHLYNGHLIVIGKIGVIALKIKGKNTLSEPRLLPNINTYSYIYNCQVAFGKVLLGTDKGFFDVNITDTAIDMAIPLRSVLKNYRFICKYAAKTINIKKTDTLILYQEDLKLQFDIVNPYGSGQVKYTTWLGAAVANMLTSNELNLPHLEPDKYYRLKIVANDGIWRSDAQIVTIYVQPKWYQTQTMKKVILTSAILFIILLVVISVLITRRLVLNAAKKRNLRMELELRSIYAQINPHFIFNSLNSALLLVSKNKTDEAYTHISKFSRLLRSYIRSSRNKLILLADEIKNLSNYIDLQQVRFKDKFNYKIIVGNDVDADNIFIPSLLLQPFVENAIEHGLLNMEAAGNLVVEFKRKGNTLVCIIDDDGIGRKESKLNKIPDPRKDESYGELLIKDLVSIFNKYEHMNIRVGYADKEAPLSGTTVTINIDLNATKQI